MKRLLEIAVMVFAVCFFIKVPVQAAEIPAATDFSAVFDAGYYYSSNLDLQAALGEDGAKLLEHFITFGMKEGRAGNAEFDVHAYMENNLDLLPILGVKDLQVYYYHYMQHGKAEGRVASAKNTVLEENEIASFSTNYNMEEDRAVNVELASERIDGIIVEPGETFSFSNSILSRTVENGYVMAPSFASGRVVTSVGGGICQVSSTLYTTMMLSLLPATERYPHSLAVDYVPEGLDSAIVEGVKDLKFKNTYDFPIKITSEAVNGTVTVGIYKEV